MIWFDNNKQAYAFEIPNYICKIEDALWAQYAGTDKWDIVDGVFTDITDTPEYIAKHLAEAKEAKYQEANTKARRYLESGEALFTFEKDDNIYHIEATDGNIAKIGLKATALLMAGDTKTTFTWNTKEDINIQINALEGKFIAEGLGEVQDEVWIVKFPAYIKAINEAKTVKQVEAIEINYEGVN